MLMVSSHLSECYIETEQEVTEKERIRKESVKQLVDWRQEVGRDLRAGAGLFGVQRNEVSLKEERDYAISNDELRFIRSMVAMPVQPKSKNPYENSMVLNHIFIHEAGGAEMSRISEGGFASILLTELKYWYVYSSEGHEFMSLNQFENKSPKNMLHKFVAVKRELEGVERGGRAEGGRNRHEMKILKKIKNGSSIFLAKYYIPINKPSPFGEAILMDYIPFKNLGDYLRSARLSLSLLSRLYLMFSIVQALRYLRDYRIVHLDLKPNNIMIFCNMLVKLIDFGESYHPEVCHSRTPLLTKRTAPASPSPTAVPNSSPPTPTSPARATSSPSASSSTRCSTPATPSTSPRIPPCSTQPCSSTSATGTSPPRSSRTTAIPPSSASSTPSSPSVWRRTPIKGPNSTGLRWSYANASNFSTDILQYYPAHSHLQAFSQITPQHIYKYPSQNSHKRAGSCSLEDEISPSIVLEGES
jgi:hypothetical protein